MKVETVTREKVIELARTMPLEKLASWYEFGLFIQWRPLILTAPEATLADQLQLKQECATWEAASDEDWLKLEDSLS